MNCAARQTIVLSSNYIISSSKEKTIFFGKKMHIAGGLAVHITIFAYSAD
jgi:hypothetical protein